MLIRTLIFTLVLCRVSPSRLLIPEGKFRPIRTNECLWMCQPDAAREDWDCVQDSARARAVEENTASDE